MPGKWEGWNTTWERVPVQYGGWSRRPRRVIHIALIGSVPRLGHCEVYYRIADGEQGAGRIFTMRTWKQVDPHDGTEKTWRKAYYVRYGDLPQDIRQHIESGQRKTFYDFTAKDDEKEA